MATFTTSDNKWTGSFTLAKQTGTTLSVPSSGKYVDKDIALTLNVRSATASLAAPASASITSVSFTYNTTNTNYTISGSAAISGTSTLTVSQSGWVGSNITAAASGSATVTGSVARVGLGADITNGGARKPSISKESTPTGVVNAASGNATTTAPSSGVYVAVKSAASTTTLTAKAKVTTAGYGTTNSTTGFTVTNATATVGASASDMTYIPITIGAVKTPATTITANPIINNTPSSNKYTVSVSASQAITPTVSTTGWVSGSQMSSGTVSVSGSLQLNQSTLSAASVNSSSTTQTVTIGAGYYHEDRTVTVNAMNSVTPAFDGGALTGQGATAAFANVATTTTNNGISVQAKGTAGRAAVLYNGAVNGYVNVADDTTASAAVAASTWNGTTYYISGITVPKDVPFNLTATADTALDTTSDITITNNAYRALKVTNSGAVTITSNTSNSGTININAYNSASTPALTGNKEVVTGGKWKTQTITPGASQQGPYYGETYVNAASSGTSAVITSGVGTASVGDPAYNSTNENFTVTVTGSVAAPSVGTAGYISSTIGTKNGNSITTTTKTLAKVGVGATLTGTGAITPSIIRTDTTATTAQNVGSAAATTSVPASGFFVSVQSQVNTKTVTATPKVTTAGYGTTTSGQYNATNATATVGANASSITYIPLTTGAVNTPATTITANPSINNTPSSSKYTISVSKTQTVTPTVGTSGWVTSSQAAGGTITVSGSLQLNQSTLSATAITPTTAAQTVTIGAGYHHQARTVTVSGMTATSVTYGASTMSGTAVTRGTAYWGTGYVTSGTMNAATFASSATSGKTYLDISNATDAPILVAGDYLYINKGYTDDLKISLAKLVPDGSDVKGHGDYLLSGHSAYDNDGTLVSGTIPTNTASGITFSGQTATVAAGYYATNTSNAMTLASIKSGTTTISSISFGYDSTNTRFNVTGSGTVSAPSVTTAGYISSSVGTRTTNSAALNATVARIYLGTTKSGGDLTVAPTLARTAKPSGDTWVDAASGAATTTKPTSGPYVQIDAAAATNALKIKGKVTTAGYGTTAYFGTSEDSYTVGAAAATTRYVPIKTATVTPTAGTASATGGTASVNVTGVSTTSTNTGYSISASATGGSASTTTSTLAITEGYVTSAQTATVAAKSASGASSSTAVYIAKGALKAEIQTNTAGSAGMAASGFTALSGTTSSYYVSLSTTAGSVVPKASVNTEGYVKTETATASAVTVSVNGNGSKLYIPTNSITGSVVDLSAPTVTATLAGVSGLATTSTATDYYITLSTTYTSGSVKGKATAGTTTGIVAASSSHTSGATTITPTVTGNGSKLYLKAAVLGSEGAVSTTPSVTISGTCTMATTNTATDYYFTRTGVASAGTVQTKYKATSAGYTPTVAATNGGTVSVTPTKTADATIYVPSAGLTFSGGALTSKGATAAFASNITTASTDAGNNGLLVTAKGTAGRAAVTYTNTAGYIPAHTSAQSGSAAVAASTWNGTNYYLTGVKIAAPSSGTAQFSITVPNGNTIDFITFVFSVDSSGNVTVAGPD